MRDLAAAGDYGEVHPLLYRSDESIIGHQPHKGRSRNQGLNPLSRAANQYHLHVQAFTLEKSEPPRCPQMSEPKDLGRNPDGKFDSLLCESGCGKRNHHQQQIYKSLHGFESSSRWPVDMTLERSKGFH